VSVVIVGSFLSPGGSSGEVSGASGLSRTCAQ
jgi:hypothetical protein